MEVPINLTGGSYEHKSRPLSRQLTRNFWPQLQTTQKTKSPYVLVPFYGLKPWATNTGSKNRGMIENQGTLYKVTDNTFYSVDSAGVHTALGTVSGSNRCFMKAMGSQIVIVNGNGVIYNWDGTNLQLNADTNIGIPRGVAVLNSQAIYDAGTGQGWSMSDVGTPLIVNGLNYANAESSSDALLIPYAFRETAYFMGTKTIELWWNSGQGNPPLDKIQGAVINIGLGAIHSAAENADYIFLLGDDLQVHSLTGGSSSVDSVISTLAMAKQFQDYAVTSDAIGWTMQLEGQWFYILTFPTENKTWAYCVGGEWFEWGTGLTGRIRADSYASCYGKHLVADYASGNIYELDADTYTDISDPIIRTRITAPLHSGLFQQDGKAFEMSSLEILLEAGVGAVNGQGINPELMIAFSRDGGKTFGTERFIKTGQLNQTRRKAVIKNIGRFHDECVIQLRVSDPVYWAVYSAVANVEICI